MLAAQLQPFPWQTENWELVHSANQAGRMAHAILLTGPKGIGLQHFAKCLTASLLCENVKTDAAACGDCRSCHLLEGESHPDLFYIAPEEPGKQIKVDKIRSLIDSAHLKSQYRNYKIAIITPADAMNRSAANSLLKILEEPPEDSLFMLLSHKPNSLPITIRSRCQRINLNPTFDQATIRWVNENLQPRQNAEHLLKMAGGAPLAIEYMLESHVIENQQEIVEDLFSLKEMGADPVKIAEKWKTHDPAQVLLWLSQLFADMVRMKSLAHPLRFSDSVVIGRLQELIKQLELRELTGFYHLLLEKYSMSTGSISYNAQGLLEDVIICWQCLGE